jgi:hypothetical protein
VLVQWLLLLGPDAAGTDLWRHCPDVTQYWQWACMHVTCAAQVYLLEQMQWLDHTSRAWSQQER